MKGGMGKILKQVQKAQVQMAKMQEQLGEKTVQSSSGGGAVRAEVNGHKELLSLQIDPEVLSEENREMLEDLILAAVNEALKQVDEIVNTEMQKLTGGLNLPPGMF
ncbi:MAG: YbaB/EbfC family nucleoid-associated protein [Dethiobacteria bacterium]|jgi:DNA-binding YbaB/EbfC family protein|nr:YbaB/EbfC family nucleoid-associated protein [Bacillota bacterium]NMD33045.1 YbaB/EbfC family nucleoid-associated protein [Bacillota bacterium]HOB29581.1 YbaB/EbfC family nucleoid-associated protein [Bacillota bacterium]HPZ40886.1 YbaB/EbfC family nucleoid-associated protein [Bacillota bacterium]HQD51976.1 YbaB/EbfC family nucleoid-associated protein [Bacillota bacterium]